MMTITRLPKKVEVNGVNYKLEWTESKNMDAFEAWIKTGLKFDSEEEADEYQFDCDLEDEFLGVGYPILYANGMIKIVRKVF